MLSPPQPLSLHYVRTKMAVDLAFGCILKLTGSSPRDGSKIHSRLCEAYPEVSTICRHFQFSELSPPQPLSLHYIATVCLVLLAFGCVGIIRLPPSLRVCINWDPLSG